MEGWIEIPWIEKIPWDSRKERVRWLIEKRIEHPDEKFISISFFAFLFGAVPRNLVEPVGLPVMEIPPQTPFPEPTDEQPQEQEEPNTQEAFPTEPVSEPSESDLKTFGHNLPGDVRPKRRDICHRLFDLLKNGYNTADIVTMVREEFQTNGFPSPQTVQNWANRWGFKPGIVSSMGPRSERNLAPKEVLEVPTTPTPKEEAKNPTSTSTEFRINTYDSRGGVRRLL